MQDTYVGDIGDLAKLGLLRALSKGKRQLGVAWYLYPHEEGPDGQHLEYLGHPKAWQALDQPLFDGLRRIITRWQNYQGERSVTDAAYTGLLPGAVFANELLCHHPRADNEPDRSRWRREWFGRVRNLLRGCDIVFADPDNGLYDSNRFDWDGREHSWKRLPLCEALELSDNHRTAVVYHHYTRFKGGPGAEIQHWMRQLPGCTHAFHCRRYGNRTFFVLNADPPTVANLQAFVDAWRAAERRAGVKAQTLSELVTPE